MAKGQQKTNKESKKPKKAAAGADKSVSLGSSAFDEPIRAAVTTAVAPKGKAKNKPAF
ncbi:MAG: hypothetical protein NWS83_08625 [Burkholderiaceae bacterium]|jgi:hypothetical protein|nr:hypothetical protein [Burkholderiaceae bacterium]